MEQEFVGKDMLQKTKLPYRNHYPAYVEIHDKVWLKFDYYEITLMILHRENKLFYRWW
jgi:hypothetical protein